MEYNASTAPQVPGPTESQQEGSIFDPYLQSVPEDAREYVTGYLKDAEKNVNSRLQEAADLQQRFGAYKDIDLSAFAPQQLAQVLEFVQQVGSSPEAYQEWLRSEAEQQGLLEAQQQQGIEPEGGDDLETYVQSRLEQALNPLQQRLEQYDERFGQAEQAEAQRSMEGHIESTLSRLESENGVKLTDEQQEAVLALGDAVDTDDWVEQGFAKYQALAGKAQAGFVQGKLNQPRPPIRSGGQAAPQKPKSFADVREMALQRAEEAM